MFSEKHFNLIPSPPDQLTLKKFSMLLKRTTKKKENCEKKAVLKEKKTKASVVTKKKGSTSGQPRDHQSQSNIMSV